MTDVQQKQKQPLQPRDDVVQLNWQYFEKCTTRAASSSSRWFWQAHYAWVRLLDLKATVWNAPASVQAASGWSTLPATRHRRGGEPAAPGLSQTCSTGADVSTTLRASKLCCLACPQVIGACQALVSRAVPEERGKYRQPPNFEKQQIVTMKTME